MACGCTSPSISFSAPLAGCTIPTSGTDSSCVYYTGPALTCSDAETNSTIEVIVQKLDAAICQGITYDWSSFDYACLADVMITTDPQGFVEAASAAICTLQTDLNTAETSISTLQSSLSTLTTTVTGIRLPTLTSCGFVGIISSDTSTQALSKLATAACTLHTRTDLSAVDWDQCFTVSTPPTTVGGGFDLLIDWICTLNDSLLPTFDTSATCIGQYVSGGGDTETTLEDTVQALIDYACANPAFDPDDISYTTCLPEPSGSYGLADVINLILTKSQTLFDRSILSFSGDFIVTADGCNGKSVALSPSIVTDEKVKVQSSGAAGYLNDKITVGANVSKSITGDTVQIAATNNKVKADNADAAEDFLINKISAITDTENIVGISKTYDASGDTVQLQPTIDYDALAAAQLTRIANDSTLFAQFSTLVCSVDCTEPARDRTISGNLLNSWSTALAVGYKFTQDNPTLTFYDVLDASIGTGATQLTGSYAITSTDSPLVGTLSIKNSEAFGITYNAYVGDPTNGDIVISDASNLSGTIAATTTLAIPFTYGTGGGYTLYINISKAT